MADAAKKPEECAAIRALTSLDALEPYSTWARCRPSFVDALEMWTSVEMSFARLVEIAPPIQARLYSIASAPQATGTPQVELCCGVVLYCTGDDKLHEGLCSTYLAGAPAVACRVKACPHMRLPDDATVPIMCVCGGTGLAPFLGFVQHRAAQRRSGMQVGPVQLYFGCRAEYDCLHGAKLRQLEREGVVRFSVSYSRQQGSPKEYVYHALERDASAVKELLAPGASGRFYLCGSASTLAKDCTNVLASILGNGDLQKGHQSISDLQGSGRIAFDVWG